MKQITDYKQRRNIQRNFFLVLFFLAVQIMVSQGQTSVALPLDSYFNDGNGTLTPTIKVPKFQANPTGVTSVKLGGAALPPWLEAKVTDGGATYNVDLLVKLNMCVSIPMVPTAGCDAECDAAVQPMGTFLTAPIHKCYSLEIIADGQTSNHSLCVYGEDPTLLITTMGQNFNTTSVGGIDTKAWSANRATNLKWSITAGAGANADYLKIDPITDETKNPVHLTYHPMATEMGSWTLKLSAINPHVTNVDACYPPVSVVIPVKATDVTVPGKVDMVIVVDVSGSMGDKGACEPNPIAIYRPEAFPSKLEFVKTNFKALYVKIRKLAPAGSRIGLVTFADNAEEKKIGGNFFNDVSTDATENGINAIVSGLAPTSSTNMGGGLNAAIQQLKTSPAVKKQIILLTNGMQNGNQLVRTRDNTIYIDLNNNSSIDANETIPDDIQIFCIAIFQPSSEYLNLLKALSKTNSRFNDVCQLDHALDEAYGISYSANSPKLLAFRRGNFSGNTTTINYSITESDFDGFIASVSSIQNTNITYKVEKNVGGSWKDITSGGTMKQTSPNYTIFSINNLPKTINGENITPLGDFRLVVNSTIANADFYSSMILDDHGLKHATFVQNATFRSGDTIDLGVRLRNNVTPVHQPQATVRAVIHRPVLCFEKAMANTKVPADRVVKTPYNREKKGSIFKKYSLQPPRNGSFEVGLPLIEQKFKLLVEERGFLGTLRYQTDTLILPEIINGIYSANYSHTDVTGMYRVEYLINGNIPAVGNYFRTQSHSTPVLFGKPDRAKSSFYLFDESGSYFLSLQPVDIYGNYLGMGKADQIKIQMTLGSNSQLLDYLDGRYVIPLNVPPHQNPYVIITIAGMEFYRGFLFNIPEKKFFVGIQGGITTPLSTFSNTADPKFMAGLKIGYRFNRTLGVLAEGGYFAFKDATHTSSDPNIFGGAAGLFFIPTALPANINVQLEGTFGYYKPKNISGTWGVRGGLDLGRYFQTWFSMSLNTSYYRINTSPDKIDFMVISLIAKFHF